MSIWKESVRIGKYEKEAVFVPKDTSNYVVERGYLYIYKGEWLNKYENALVLIECF